MMKRILISMVLLAAVSCQKNERPTPASHPFRYKGQDYATLAEAVSLIDKDSVSVITLTGDAVGEGACIREGMVVLDLQSFTFFLNRGASIDATDNHLCITGEGGGIEADGSAPILIGRNGWISLDGNVFLRGENCLESSSDIEICEEFTGSLSGNVSIDDAGIYLQSSRCHMDIPVLTVKGEDAALEADSAEIPDDVCVDIGIVISDNDYPVTSVYEGVFSKSCNAHIHKLVSVRIPGNCMAKEREELICSECGFSKLNREFEGDYGPCDESDFIHHPAVKADELNFGNVEYWECPACGKCYSDPYGTTESDYDIFLFPSRYSVMEQMRELNSNCSEEVNSAAVVATTISLLITIGQNIASIIKSKNSYWEQISSQLDEVMVQIDKISLDLANVARQVRTVSNRMAMIQREEDINQLYRISKMVLGDICRIKTDNADEAKQMEEIRKLITDWGTFNVGRDKLPPYSLTSTLISNYLKDFQGRTYPEVCGEFVNSLCVWEHEGFKLRQAMISRDRIAVGIAQMLTNVYNNDIRQFESPEFKKSIIEQQTKLYSEYLTTATAAEKKIESDSTNYRKLFYGKQEITYLRKANGPHDFYQWLCNHRDARFHRKNKNNWAVNSCDQMMKETGVKFDKTMSTDVIRFIDQIYNRKADEHFAWVLKDRLGFELPGCERVAPVIVVKRDIGFRHENDNDTAYPSYKIFHWHSWASKIDEDDFGVFGVGWKYPYSEQFRMDASMQSVPNRYYPILKDCNIKVSTGIISDMGKRVNTSLYYTIVEK